jgi:hypothetical protein
MSAPKSPSETYERAQRPAPAGMASRPEITTMAEAIAYVQSIVDKIRPFPEIVTVCDPASAPAGIIDSTHPDYSLTHAEVRKMTAIRKAVVYEISKVSGMPSIPELLLIADSGPVASIWDDTSARQAPVSLGTDYASPEA